MDTEVTRRLLDTSGATENNQRLPRVAVVNRNGKKVRNIICTHILGHIMEKFTLMTLDV